MDLSIPIGLWVTGTLISAWMVYHDAGRGRVIKPSDDIGEQVGCILYNGGGYVLLCVFLWWVAIPLCLYRKKTNPGRS